MPEKYSAGYGKPDASKDAKKKAKAKGAKKVTTFKKPEKP